MNTARQTAAEMPLTHLLESLSLDGESLQACDGISIRGMTLDSRKASPGDLFVALFGKNHDARDYIDLAVQRGATAVLADASGDWKGCRRVGNVPVITVDSLRVKLGAIAAHFYAHPSEQLPVVGVTGTNGKTSCTQFVGQLLAGLDHRCGIVGTLGYGVFPSLEDTGFTTPDSIVLQAALADVLHQRASCVALEVSSQGLHQHRLNGVRFHSAIFTNLTRDHLDYHGSMAAYAGAKRRLFEHDALNVGIVNADDSYAACMLNALPRSAQSLTYSLSDSRADVYARELSFESDGYRARVHTPWGEGDIRGRLLGSFNFSNVLAAITAVMTLPWETDLSVVLAQAERLKPVSGRMELLGDSASDVTAVVDYAHTPDGLRSALKAIHEHVDGRIWCVFGCGGNRDQGKRPLMAEVAEELADFVVLTDDNPRNENPDDIIRQILLGFDQRDSVHVERDRASAIAYAISSAAPGDIVLVAGKGHESYQDICGQRMAFSDIAQVRLALQKRSAAADSGVQS
ncbi:UDP-N-acetylmuramoyl-L-alanyl-D-glutamate--2,6-diaminopimelate ligase [Pseudohongiella acticola]|uniref:UDP-N-acetylmuramoyl-L-alanyl-D-glutamate--2, 6-diaminopimelate ligase n=1 Tax=Pseudohongiella acticola TaxID=1524254 RepID=UPI0030EE4193